MQATTQRLVREAFATAILAITPRSVNLPQHVWHRVNVIGDVNGAAPRTFLIRFLPGELAGDGFHGDGNDMDADCQIWTSYAGLGDDEDGPTIDEDARQLWCTLADIRDPTTPGLHSPVSLGWSYENDDPGQVHGYHLFRVRYLVSDSVNL